MKMLIFILLATLINAKDLKIDKVIRVYDGDTITIYNKDITRLFGFDMSIRINGIDTPEIKGKCRKEKVLAQKAKSYLVRSINEANIIELRNIKKGKYFRLVGDLYIDNKNISEDLINNNLAVRYNGGKKIKDWCK